MTLIAGKVVVPCDVHWAWLLPGGERLIAGCGDTVRLVAIDDGKQLASWPSSDTWQGAFSADGSTFASAEHGTIHVARTRDGKSLAHVPLRAAYTLNIAVARDGKQLTASSVGKPPEVWSILPAARRVATLACEFGTGCASQWSSDARALAVATDDTIVRLYDPASSWRPVAVIDDAATLALALAWSDDGKQLAIGRVGGVVELRDATGALIRRFPRRGDRVVRLQFVGQRLFAVHLTQGNTPPELVHWALDGKAQPITDARPVIGGGVIDGVLWLVSPADAGIELWKPS